MNVFLPDKDTLFFLEQLSQKIIMLLPQNILPVLPLVGRNFDERAFLEENKKKFLGCEYEGPFYNNEGFFFLCTLFFNDFSIQNKFFFARQKDEDFEISRDISLVLDENYFKRKSRIIRKAQMSENCNGWEFFDIQFLKENKGTSKN